MKYYEISKLSEKQVEALKPKKMKHNEYICETAGFVPLEVKFARFEQAGIRAQFNSSEFTSTDYRDMYLDPDFQIYPSDDIEDIEAKTIALRHHIEEVKARVMAKSNGQPVKAGTEEPSPNSEPQPDSKSE